MMSFTPRHAGDVITDIFIEFASSFRFSSSMPLLVTITSLTDHCPLSMPLLMPIYFRADAMSRFQIPRHDSSHHYYTPLMRVIIEHYDIIIAATLLMRHHADHD